MFGLFYFDWTILIVLPAFFISIWAQYKVSSTYKKYSTVLTKRNLTGFASARAILDANGLHHVKIEHVRGHLTDHYDPRANVIRLSDSVYDSTSTAAVGVAAHEAGHAVQYAQDYSPIKFRMAIIPATRFGSMLAIPLFFIGLILASDMLLLLGIVLYSLVALFQLATLPVEFNASRRAINAINSTAILTKEEASGAKAVLSAAAMTYVAAMIQTLLTLLYYLSRFTGRRD